MPWDVVGSVSEYSEERTRGEVKIESLGVGVLEGSNHDRNNAIDRL